MSNSVVINNTASNSAIINVIASNLIEFINTAPNIFNTTCNEPIATVYIDTVLNFGPIIIIYNNTVLNSTVYINTVPNFIIVTCVIHIKSFITNI